MKVYHARTLEEKGQGVSIFGDSEFVNSVMVFHDIGPGAAFHMQTVGYPIGIISLDRQDRVLDKAVMQPRLGTYRTPDGTANVVELSSDLYDEWQIGDRFSA